MPQLDPENYRARRFKTALDPTVEIALAMREIVRHINRLDRSFIQVGEAGFVTRATIPPADQAPDLVRTFDDAQIAAGEGDWDLGPGIGVVGSEIP